MSPSKVPASRMSAADSFNQICTVRIELVGTDPLIWREVEVPTSVTLKVLHDIVQITMGWFDQHLWEFRIDERIYGPLMDEVWDAPKIDIMKTRLRDVLRPRKTKIDYLYDYGDNWEHRITVTRIRAGEPGVSYPNYVGGESSCPPEDCGGLSAFYDMLDILSDPKHPDHDDVAAYLEGYDPKQTNEFALKIELSRIANRRNAVRTRIARKTA